ncbi:MAG: hypothetical protein IJZ57_03610, partial [Clostridia bacterium]|nr:hypothetical protein [Clostridia bacterium]
MIKKLCKRGLSLVLALVLVATTFFIFDPDLLRVESDAYAEVETVEQATPLSAQTVYATETIYLKAGSSAFQYYENFSYSSGAVTNPVDTSGSVYFKNDDAAYVSLYVNNVYKKGENGGSQVASKSLTINSTNVETYAGLGNDGTGTRASGATLIASATGGTLNYAITSGSLSGYLENGVYIIQWLIEYSAPGKSGKNVTRTAFAYTGIYAPTLLQAGITYDWQHSDDDATQEAFSFVTGVEDVAGGNAKSNLIETTNDNRKMAPLVGFVGQVNDKNNYTVAGGLGTSHVDTSSYFTTTSQGGVAATSARYDRDGGDSTDRDAYAVTNDFSAYSNEDFFDDNGVPSVTYHTNLYRENMCNEGWSTGVGYITVDRSRYANYAQIPNLSVGWLCLYSYYGNETNELNWIKVMSKSQTNFKEDSLTGYSVSVDTSGTSEKQLNSMTRGLYKINGPVLTTDGLLQIAFKSKTDRNRTLNDHAIHCFSNVGLYTTVANHETVRRQYNSALCSVIDASNMNDYYSGANTYASYCSQLKAVAEELCDPTAHSMQSATALRDYSEKIVEGINGSFGADVYFYVPEAIYTTPAATYGSIAGWSENVSHLFAQLYVNNDISATNDTATATATTDTYGKLYFKYNHAENAKLSYEFVSDTWPELHNDQSDAFDGGVIAISETSTGGSKQDVEPIGNTNNASGIKTVPMTSGTTKFMTGG